MVGGKSGGWEKKVEWGIVYVNGFKDKGRNRRRLERKRGYNNE